MKLEFEERTLRPVGEEQMDRAREQARGAARGRGLVRYHEHEEPVQRLLHAIEPRSYMRPHMHRDPDKLEAFIALHGGAFICRWSDAGELLEAQEISAAGPLRGVEVPPAVWHSLLAIEPGTVLYEVIDGPFRPDTHKRYADWAPEEGSPEGGRFLEELRARLGLAAL